MAEASNPAEGITAHPAVPTSTPITPSNSPAPESAPATPPVTLPAQPETRANRAEYLLVPLLLVLAFFLGSFAVRNADFLLNLASGRLIAQGEYHFGVDPFSFTTGDEVWVNHSWLFDWLIYLLSRTGDAAPILFKAIVLVAMTLVLLGIRRPGQSLWLPVFGIGLGVLVMSPRFLMQPICMSFLFLAITISLLYSKRFWLIPPLIVLWVNMDAWFILGPLTLALYFVGSLIQRWRSGTAVDLKKLGLVFVAGLAACFVNPYGYRAFELPPEVAYLLLPLGRVLPSWMLAAGKTVQVLTSDSIFAGTWLSPLSRVWRERSDLGLNVAGMAYFVLLLGGAASFAGPLVSAPRREALTEGFQWQRFVVWLFFALLSLIQARLIPFFAVVGAPIMVLNFQDSYAGAGVNPVHARRRAGIGRLVTAAGLLILLFLAWPGWLHGPILDFRGPRRVAWETAFDPSLEKAALELGELKRRGLIRHGFAFSPDMGCYCAWFAPEVKSFLDWRFALFSRQAEVFVTTRKRLIEAAKGTEPGIGPDRPENTQWQKVAVDFDLNYLVLTKFNQPRHPSQFVAGACWHNDPHWPWLYGDGRTLVFGWNPEAAPSPLAQRTISLDQMAFGNVPLAEQAPAAGTPMPDEDRTFVENYLESSSRLPMAVDRVKQYQSYQSVYTPQLRQSYQVASRWGIFNAPMALSSAVPLCVSVPAAFAPRIMPPPLYGPAGAPILMMRQARRAVAGDPYDATVWEALEAAVEAVKAQEESWAPGREPAANFRQNIRKFQLIAALTAYLKLRPDDAGRHFALFQIFNEMHFLDVAEDHLEQTIKNWDRQPSPPTEAALKQRQAQKKALEDEFKRRAEDIKKRQEDFDLRSSGKSPLEKYSLAILQKNYRQMDAEGRPRIDPMGLGLARKAQETLEQIKPGQLNEKDKIALAFAGNSLRLQLGDVPEVSRDFEFAKGLGPAYLNYLHYCVFCAAATGNYATADAALGEAIGLFELEKNLYMSAASSIMDVAILSASEIAPTIGIADGSLRTLYSLTPRWQDTLGRLRSTADLYLTRGLLALEHGDTENAGAYFQRSLELTDRTVFFPDRPIARGYHALISKYHGPK